MLLAKTRVERERFAYEQSAIECRIMLKNAVHVAAIAANKKVSKLQTSHGIIKISKKLGGINKTRCDRNECCWHKKMSKVDINEKLSTDILLASLCQ